jgi:hypothetical protein
MRPTAFPKWLLLGLGGGAVAFAITEARRRHRRQLHADDELPPDAIGELYRDDGELDIEPLDVDAIVDAEEVVDDGEVDEEVTIVRPKDAGELYGARTPPASDRDLAAPEDHDSFERSESGENWLESLRESATEGGPEPEIEIVVIDETDPEAPHNPTMRAKKPIADKGSGGIGGM